jgi:hypothetical protein
MPETGHAPNRAFVSQAGNVHLNGAQLYDSAGLAVPQGATITPAAGSANVSLVSFQVVDAAGNPINRVVPIDVWLSDAATGIGLTSTAASGAVAAGASGTDFGVLATKKALRSLTDATGLYVLSITDTGKSAFVPCCSLPLGKIAVGSALVAGNYG